MSKSRLAYIDIAKGILISIVIFHHISFQANLAGIHNGCIQWNFTFLPLYASWFMPAFFMITGYCSIFNRSIRSFVKDNIATLIWPMLVFYIFTSLFKWHTLSFHSLIVDLSNGINWFLTALFGSKLLYFFINRYVHNYIYRIAVLLFLAIFAIYCNDVNFMGYNWLHYRHAIYLTLYLGVGNLIKNSNIWYDLALRYSWMVFVVLFLLCKFMDIDVPGVAGLWINFDVLLLPLHIFMALTGSFMVIKLSWVIGSSKLLEYIGRNSLIYYLTHATVLGFVILFVTDYLLNPQNKFEALGFSCIVFSGTISICSILSLLFNSKRLFWMVRMPNIKLLK